MTAAASNQSPEIRVMVVDDHEVVRGGLCEIVRRAPGLLVVAEAGTVAEAVQRAQLVRPHVLVVDLQLPDGSGLDIIRQLRRSLPDTRAVVLTSFDDDDALVEALRSGAHAFLLKTARGADIAKAIALVAGGRNLLDERTVTRRRSGRPDPTASLTPSERRVLQLIGDGLPNREIGERLGIAEKTVKNHVTSLLAKMGLQRRTQVAAWVAGQRTAPWRQ